MRKFLPLINGFCSGVWFVFAIATHDAGSYFMSFAFLAFGLLLVPKEN